MVPHVFTLHTMLLTMLFILFYSFIYNSTIIFYWQAKWWHWQKFHLMLNLSFGHAYTDCSKLHTAWSRCECGLTKSRLHDHTRPQSGDHESMTACRSIDVQSCCTTANNRPACSRQDLVNYHRTHTQVHHTHCRSCHDCTVLISYQ